ncbi:MAG: hypothetical protein WA879_08815, partial [Candidatus Acidiferrales bacterium]
MIEFIAIGAMALAAGPTPANTAGKTSGHAPGEGATQSGGSATAKAGAATFGPANPFYAPSSLPFHAPPFDKIKDEDYQPAIEAGMAAELVEIQAIADNAAPPTFENTVVAMEKTGQLFQRAMAAFSAVAGANTDPLLQKVQA